ncbi:uncharacterized protein [Hetaerina americana]|uniref:uncharacterized protein n=1 Tax=Hetaerina americana TaxID=62018 RepID=UPI003A7F33CF
MCSSNINASVNILSIPAEVLTKILLQCDVIDILSFCCTSKHLNRVIDNAYFWKQKWKTIVSSTKFTLPKIADDSLSQYKNACIRYVVVADEESDEYMFPSCQRCDSYSCMFGCVEDWKPKLVVDLGSKITRIFNATTIEIRSHLSAYRIQDNFLKHGNKEAYMHMTQSPSISMSGVQTCGCVEGVSIGRHAHDYDLIQMKDLDCVHDRKAKALLTDKRAFCVTCSSIHHLSSPCIVEEYRIHNFNCEQFKNEFCLSLQENSDSHLLSPGLGMKNPVGFPFLVTSYLREVLMIRFFNSIHPYVLRAPGSTVFICVPNSGSPPNVCRSVLNFLFVEMKVGRVCLIPKALGLAKSESASCCIAVDSGAFSTSVAVVVDEKVVAVKDIPVGGWHLSKELHSSLVARGCISPEGSGGSGCIHRLSPSEAKASRWKRSARPPQVPIVSFDEASVKSMCRLAPSLHSKKPSMNLSQTQTVYLNRACNHEDCSKDLVQVCLRNEFTTGPEVHFAALDLPRVICDLTKGLPHVLRRRCLSNILLSGGNSSLNGLVTRLGYELRSILPQFHENINVILPFGPSELHTVMGASLMEYNYDRPLQYADNEEFQSYCSHHKENNSDQPFVLQKEVQGGAQSQQLPRTHHRGEPYWLTREEFIVFGPGF